MRNDGALILLAQVQRKLRNFKGAETSLLKVQT